MIRPKWDFHQFGERTRPQVYRINAGQPFPETCGDEHPLFISVEPEPAAGSETIRQRRDYLS